jgi:hypothetical protein
MESPALPFAAVVGRGRVTLLNDIDTFRSGGTGAWTRGRHSLPPGVIGRAAGCPPECETLEEIVWRGQLRASEVFSRQSHCALSHYIKCFLSGSLQTVCKAA